MKHIMRDFFKSTPSFLSASFIARFFNEAYQLKSKVDKEFAPQILRITEPAWINLTHTELCNKVQLIAEQRFRYKIDDVSKRLVGRREPLIRALCLKMGIQISDRIFKFDADDFFRESDVVGVYPIVKYPEPEVSIFVGPWCLL
jgi:Translation initiation factor eIF3 subunit 135